METGDSEYDGKVLLDRPAGRQRSLERNLRRRERLQLLLRETNARIASDRAYLRVVGVRTGKPRDRRLAGDQPISKMVLAVLKDGKRMNAWEIIDAIDAEFGRAVVRDTLSSILAKMKNGKRQLDLIDGRYGLRPKIK